MRRQIKQLHETIRLVFDVLDLIVFRATLLGLAAFGAYALLAKF